MKSKHISSEVRGPKVTGDGLGLSKVQVVFNVSPGKISRRRRQEWPSAQAALEHYAGKANFACWDPRVLNDYIACGIETAGGRAWLAFHREIAKGVSAEQALRQVQRNAIQQNGRRLGAWSALVIYGSDR